jgi:Secretion system C-terminal sorting domain
MIQKRTLILFLFIFSKIYLYAQWNYTATQNTPVDTGINKANSNPSILNDGNGGYYIAWMKRKPGIYGTEIYAQHINVNGVKQWPDTGIVICNADFNQVWPKVITDGSGGAIIAWQDERLGFNNWDIYAQRITSNGTILWNANGVPVFDHAINELGPDIISDGNGGAILVTWRTSPSGNASDIFSQRINSMGTRLWPTNGVIICNANNRQAVPKLVSDGNNGAIIAWWDFRNSPTNDVTDIYAQRVNATGTTMWQNNGISICSMPYDQYAFQIAGDNNSGAYLVWQDLRNTTSTTDVADIFAQHINGNGAALWATDGISVCSAANTQTTPSVIADNNNGITVCWWDIRFNKSAIYAQRLSSAGIPSWTTDGIPVCANAGPSNSIAYPFQVSDKNNGIYIFWQDQRNGGETNIYAQHLNVNGTPKWTIDGIPVCNVTGIQNLTYDGNNVTNGDVTGDGQGNAVVTWEDGRNGDEWHDIYISKLSDGPAALPIVIDIKQQCQSNLTAKGKLLNPPATASITITQDGLPLNYSAIDSSFVYFIGAGTPVGNHTVSIKYSNFVAVAQKDSTYLVAASVTPSISISGNVNVNQGQSVTLSASLTNGGNSPIFQWQESKNNGPWLDIPGATSLLIYTPLQTGDKIRCVLTSSAACSSPSIAMSNSLIFVVNIGQTSNSNNGIRFYPNPAHKILFIDTLRPADKWQTVDLYSIDGKRLIISKNITNQVRVSLDLEGYASGTYIVILRREQGSAIYFRLIKN